MSKKLKLSPWHDAKTKPVNFGVYEVRLEDGSHFANIPSYAFYGKSGWTTATELSYAFKKYIGICASQDKQWRGVLK